MENEMQHIYTTEYYPAIKKKEVIFGGRWVNLGSIKSSVINQGLKNKHNMLSLV